MSANKKNNVPCLYNQTYYDYRKTYLQASTVMVINNSNRQFSISENYQVTKPTRNKNNNYNAMRLLQ